MTRELTHEMLIGQARSFSTFAKLRGCIVLRYGEHSCGTYVLHIPRPEGNLILGSGSARYSLRLTVTS